MSTDDKLTLNHRAVVKVCRRIQESKEVRELLGYGTQTFTDLCVAAAAAENKTPREIGAILLGCKPEVLNLLPDTAEEELSR